MYNETRRNDIHRSIELPKDNMKAGWAGSHIGLFLKSTTGGGCAGRFVSALTHARYFATVLMHSSDFSYRFI